MGSPRKKKASKKTAKKETSKVTPIDRNVEHFIEEVTNDYLIYWAHGKSEGNCIYKTLNEKLLVTDLDDVRKTVALQIIERDATQANVNQVIIKNIMKL